MSIKHIGVGLFIIDSKIYYGGECGKPNYLPINYVGVWKNFADLTYSYYDAIGNYLTYL